MIEKIITFSITAFFQHMGDEISDPGLYQESQEDYICGVIEPPTKIPIEFPLTSPRCLFFDYSLKLSLNFRDFWEPGVLRQLMDAAAE